MSGNLRRCESNSKLIPENVLILLELDWQDQTKCEVLETAAPPYINREGGVGLHIPIHRILRLCMDCHLRNDRIRPSFKQDKVQR